MPKLGNQTWKFEHPPGVIGRATVAGKVESEGPIGPRFDVRHSDDRIGQDSWERAERLMFEEAMSLALEKARLLPEDLDLAVGADLNAQLTSFYFGVRTMSVPSLGVYSACASFCEASAIAAMAINQGMAKNALVGTSSHNSTAERQFRNPTEYGIQKPPSAQRTVSGAGALVLAARPSNIVLSMATIGRVIDMGIKDPWQMNAAMAPAAVNTIEAHLSDTGQGIEDYDCVATGDLGFVGLDIARDLLRQHNILPEERLTDCGTLIYRRDQPEVFSGGSGGACCTIVTLAELFHNLETGVWNRILVSATGALLSSVSAQQSESIPCISHAVVFERKEDAE